MDRLEWDDGTRSAAEGKDLASVAQRLTDAELEFWLCRIGELPCPHELGILESEGARRWGEHWKSGPLFRENQPD